MCLTINKRFQTKEEAIVASHKPLIAKKDITVYKGLRRMVKGRYSKKERWLTPYKKFEFEKGYHYYQDDDTFGIQYIYSFSGDSWEILIGVGLHACRKKARARHHSKDVFKMVVPKGAKYFENQFGDIVSTELIWRN